MVPAYLGLGSNLGNRESNIGKAIESISSFASVGPMSSMYETYPSGFSSQPRFLNAAVCVWTNLSPFELMSNLKQIEVSIGHPRSFPNGPRVIDLDILIFGLAIICSPHLTIPHPRLATRDFVLKPLAEIAPGLMHPKLNKTISDVLQELD
jgi:2-amino-4-hydroxy-6-hydroxymethyldihydropteridine diphosphokinase